MSVWKAKEFWEPTRVASLSSQESSSSETICSRGCLCVHKLTDTGSSVIIYGTWSGLLRAFLPKQALFSDEQILFERTLPQPVLHLLAGNFLLASTSTADNSFQIAVLHPASLSIYYYTSSSTENASDGLSLLRSYNLKASAFAMVSGSFGGIRGRQMICVSTLDGKLNLIDNETVIETPVLDNFLLPGPICYLPSKDAFVVGSSCWTADCYSYSELAAAAGLASTKPGQEIKFRQLWSYNCGEPILDIDHGGQLPKAPVVLLGERNIYCLEQNGVMRSIRRIDTPMNSLFLFPSEGSLNMLVTSTNRTLFVYQNMIPIWTTQFPYVVVSAQIAKIGEMEGVIVTLSEDGHVTGWFLGTNPDMYESQHTASTRNFTSDEIKEETVRLAEMIKGHDEGDTTELQQPEAPFLSVTIEEFNEIRLTFDGASGDSRSIPMSQSRVIIETVGEPVHYLQLDFHVQEPFVVKPNQPALAVLEKAATFDFSLLNTLKSIVTSLTGTVHVRFMDSKQCYHIQEESFTIPFALVAQSAPLTKRGVLKFDFEITPTPLRFLEIFPDMLLGDNEENGLTIDFYGTGYATILISKKDQAKVRVQSDEPGLVHVVCREIERRISLVHPDDSIICTTTLPISELQSLLVRKSEMEKSYKALIADLDLWTQQLFVVEKRFLARLKDRDADIVAKLEELLDTTQQKIFEIIDQCSILQTQLTFLRSTVSALISFSHFLIRLNNKSLSSEELAELEGVTRSSLDEVQDKTWEQQTSEAGKIYVEQMMAKNRISSSLVMQTDLTDPFNLLRRAYMNQLSSQRDVK